MANVRKRCSAGLGQESWDENGEIQVKDKGSPGG